MMSETFQVLGSPAPNRQDRVRALADLGFTWADLEGDPYWIDQVVMMKQDVYEELERASQQLWSIFDKAVRFTLGKHDLYRMMGIPEVLWHGLDTLEIEEPGAISRYARFDFAISNSGDIKLLELNADTPTGYVEASVVTPWMCAQYGISSPNEIMKQLVAEAWAVEQPDTVACVAYGTHAEDSGTIDMLARHSGREMSHVDCLELWVDQGIVKDTNNRVIERLFALYPKEWMAIDDGGDALAYAMEMEHVKLFNSPHAIILQSKGLQALIWGMHELGLLFNEEEHNVIERYMLPTYNKAVFDGSYVSKSMFGREGGSVQIFDPTGRLELKDEAGFDTSRFFPLVYQKRADLAQIELNVGTFHLLTGMFVIHGKPCGLLGRAGGLITGNASHFVALGVQ